MTTTDFEFEVRGGFHAVRVLRHHLAAWMFEIGVEPIVIDDVQLAVSELAANAIEASPLGEAEIEGTADAETLRLAVTNTARHAFHWSRGHDGDGPDPRAVRGRGLQIASAITDTLDISTQRGCTTAVLTKHVLGGPTIADRLRSAKSRFRVGIDDGTSDLVRFGELRSGQRPRAPHGRHRGQGHPLPPRKSA